MNYPICIGLYSTGQTLPTNLLLCYAPDTVWMMYMGMAGHILWIIGTIIFTVVMVMMYKHIRDLKRKYLMATYQCPRTPASISKIGVYEQLSNVSWDSSIERVAMTVQGRPYDKMNDADGRSHSYTQIGTTARTSSAPPNNGAYNDSDSSSYTVINSSETGTSNKSVPSDPVLAALGRTGIIVRDIRTQFERTSSELDGSTGYLRPLAGTGQNTDTPSIRTASCLAGSETATVASDRYVDRDSRTYGQTIESDSPEGEKVK